jgi:hypothetical protein
MKNKILLYTLTCLAGMLCAVSFAYAAIQCSIVPSSIPWNQSDETTWKSGTYLLTIECKDNSSPVADYHAKFSISIMAGEMREKKIAKLNFYSTPTDNNGIAYINVPLIHLKRSDGTYLHICPFDDIQYAGGEGASSPGAPPSFSRVAPITTLENPNSNNCAIPGCCEITFTEIDVSPNIVLYSLCTYTPNAEECIPDLLPHDEYTAVTTTWNPNDVCDSCDTWQCVPQTVIVLTSFTALPGNGSVTLNWKTETEIDNVGFNILRAEAENGAYVKINKALIPAKAGAAAGASYQFIDSTVKNRTTYYYKLEDIDLKDVATQHGPQSATPKWIYSFWK